MKSFLLISALALTSAVPVGMGLLSKAGCGSCPCCGCCESGSCTCSECSCDCCSDEGCPGENRAAARQSIETICQVDAIRTPNDHVHSTPHGQFAPAPKHAQQHFLTTSPF